MTRASEARPALGALPPGVTTTSASRSTSPGRSAGIVDVRSMVRFGPAISKAERMSAGRVRQIPGQDHLAGLLRAGRGILGHEHAVVAGEPLRELLHVRIAWAGRGERLVLADRALCDAEPQRAAV